MDAVDPGSLGLAALAFLMAAAFLAGLIDSIAGGGGLISLPATLVAGLPPHLALGTGKFMATVGTAVSLLTYARNRMVVWRIVAVGLVFSLLGSACGTRAVLVMDPERVGKIILWLLPVAALITFMPARPGSGAAPGRIKEFLVTPLVCGAVGFYDGFFGPGTGSFLLLALHAFLGLGLIQASGTTKAFNLASNVSSLAVFMYSGSILYLAAVPMALANMCGNVLGCRLAIRGGPGVVRGVLLFSLVLLFATLVWRYYFS